MSPVIENIDPTLQPLMTRWQWGISVRLEIQHCDFSKRTRDLQSYCT